MMPSHIELSALIRQCWQAAEDAGWHATALDSPQAKLALMHSEISEMLEEFRNGHQPTEIYYDITPIGQVGKPEGVPIELADFLIRAFDLCGILGIWELPPMPSDTGILPDETAEFGHYTCDLHVATTILFLQIEEGESKEVVGETMILLVGVAYEMAQRFGIDLDKAIEIKMAYNLTRSKRHGGKLI